MSYCFEISREYHSFITLVFYNMRLVNSKNKNPNSKDQVLSIHANEVDKFKK